jgi:oligosaccharyltransferase complex subunit delta (ribophorin II)
VDIRRCNVDNSGQGLWGGRRSEREVSNAIKTLGNWLKVVCRLSPSSPIAKPLSLSASDTLKIALTTKDGKSGARPHQAFLTIREQDTGLEESFPLSVKDNGKAKLDVVGCNMAYFASVEADTLRLQIQKDLPYQLLTSSKPLKVSVVLASFGSSTPLNQNVFDLTIQADANAPPAAPPTPERYTRKPEIHHIFRGDPKSPPKIISLVFTLAVLAALPILAGTWLFLGGNVEHMSKAFGANPVAHGLFLGSIVAMEGVFFMYYVSWNLFQTLPVAAIVGTVAFVSGSRALTEVQDRRLAGER